MTISYPEFLQRQIAQPGYECGPPVDDDRRWWQHLPWLNPYAALEAQVREARAAARHPQAQAEAEAG